MQSLPEEGGFEPPKVGDRQIYSLLPLATWLPLRRGSALLLPIQLCLRLDFAPGDFVAGGGNRTRDLLITNQVLYHLSYTGKVPNCLGKLPRKPATRLSRGGALYPRVPSQVKEIQPRPPHRR